MSKPAQGKPGTGGVCTGKGSAQTRWLCGPVTDTIMALGWIPFSLVALAVQDVEGGLRFLVMLVLLFSFSHQPLTLMLVYGDRDRFVQRPSLFRWSPLFFGLALLIVMNFSLLLLAAIAGLWNAEHTLMQRYGITRIYGRKVGQGSGGVELYLLFSWLILVLVWAAADPSMLEKVSAVGIQGDNLRTAALLGDLRPAAEFLMPFVLAAVLIFSLKWLHEERVRTFNRAKHLYLLSNIGLFVFMLFHPIAGLIGFVASHALEYFLIVNHSLLRQYGRPAVGGGMLGKAVRTGAGRTGVFAIYLFAIVLLIVLCELYATNHIHNFVFLTFGALHFFYDGFIWKLRKPDVAHSLGAVDHVA